MSKKTKRYCKACGKECFETRGAAERASYRLQKRHKHKVPPGVYWCEHCHSFHFTHYSYNRCKEIEEYKRNPKHLDLYEI